MSSDRLGPLLTAFSFWVTETAPDPPAFEVSVCDCVSRFEESQVPFGFALCDATLEPFGASWAIVMD